MPHTASWRWSHYFVMMLYFIPTFLSAASGTRFHPKIRSFFYWSVNSLEWMVLCFPFTIRSGSAYLPHQIKNWLLNHPMLEGNNILVQKSQRPLSSLYNFQIFILNNFFITKISEFISLPLSERHNWRQKDNLHCSKALTQWLFL